MKSVLVTGAGRGIGRAVSLHLVSQGWQVYAGVRTVSDGDSLVNEAGANLIPIILDVTDSAHIARLDEVLPPSLDAIVNNAGIAVDGPVECISPSDLRRQFDVNLFGTIEVTQAVLSRIRSAKGRIVFLSSISGRISLPWLGTYSASKFALEGLVDALRIELRPWSIGVSLVEPGPTDTDMWGSAENMFNATISDLSPEHTKLYSTYFPGVKRMLSLMRSQVVPVKRVVKSVDKALTSAHPAARYPVGVSSKVQLAAVAATPTAINDAVIAFIAGFRRIK
ncbi:MAG: SDR family oxidoreductase [Mycobacteriaceae bacterium]